MEGRPKLDQATTEQEFRRWYWLRSELAAFARTLGVSPSGGKVELADRIAAVLGGRPPMPSQRRTVGQQLSTPVDADTVIPVGQRSSQVLREFFQARIGDSFHFDATMRAFIATGGATLGDAIQHWHATRHTPPATISSQFELNRFTRAWFAQHPKGTHAELMAAWWVHRSLPVDGR